MIIEQTYKLLKSKHIKEIEKLVISDVRIGLYLTAVRLSDNSVGTSSTLPGAHPHCSKDSRDFGDFTPLRIRGKRVTDILETTKKSSTIYSLKTAVLSAISSKIISSPDYRIIENCDPVQLIDLDKEKTITIVGAFQSYIRKIAGTKNRLNVLELNENALHGELQKYYVPAVEYKSIIPVSDVVIITGQTLVNSTLDDILAFISPGSQVIVTGPSGNILPDVLFESGVNIIGGTRITRPEILFNIVSEGGLGYHLFEDCASKICILKQDDREA
jgi:uncharacterized protein (DUF4213/DUF364 family)